MFFVFCFLSLRKELKPKKRTRELEAPKQLKPVEVSFFLAPFVKEAPLHRWNLSKEVRQLQAKCLGQGWNLPSQKT